MVSYILPPRLDSDNPEYNKILQQLAREIEKYAKTWLTRNPDLEDMNGVYAVLEVAHDSIEDNPHKQAFIAMLEDLLQGFTSPTAGLLNNAQMAQQNKAG